MCASEFITTWQWGQDSTEAPHNHVQCAGGVEFIGDSYFVGYGNLLPESAMVRDGLSPEQIDSYTDCWQGMAALCAEILTRTRLDAGEVTWRVFARSGYGMVRNYPALVDRAPLPSAYKRWQQLSEPTPRLVIVNLGTNDFSTALEQWEPFADQGALERAFTDAYHRFLNALQQRYPDVVILLVGVPHPASELQPRLLKRICQQRTSRGESVFYCDLPSVALDGCDAHPGLAGHQQCAQVLAEMIAHTLSLAENKSDYAAEEPCE